MESGSFPQLNKKEGSDRQNIIGDINSSYQAGLFMILCRWRMEMMHTGMNVKGCGYGRAAKKVKLPGYL